VTPFADFEDGYRCRERDGWVAAANWSSATTVSTCCSGTAAAGVAGRAEQIRPPWAPGGFHATRKGEPCGDPCR
jgi:hypothetical protein